MVWELCMQWSGSRERRGAGAARAAVWARRHVTALMMAPPLLLQEQWARRHGRRHDARARNSGEHTDAARGARGERSRGGGIQGKGGEAAYLGAGGDQGGAAVCTLPLRVPIMALALSL